MKTKLYAIPDWNRALEEIGWADAPTREFIDNTIRQELTRGRITFEEQPPETPIEAGCRVTLKTESVLPKFNRPKTVLNVGTGLYDAGIEALLCGMRTGETENTTVKGEPVRFTVTKVEKKCFPELTDELVQALQLDGVTTLAGYRQRMEKTLKTEYARGLCERLLEKLLSGAEIEPPAEEDVTKVIELEYEPLRIQFRLDDVTPEKWAQEFGRAELGEFYAQIYPHVAKLFGTASREDYFESRRQTAEETVRVCLVLQAVLGLAEDPTVDGDARKKLTEAMTERLMNMIYGGS